MTDSGFAWRDSYDKQQSFRHNSLGTVTGQRRLTEGNVAGGLHTTARDYGRFLVAMLRGTGLKAETRRLMLTPQIKVSESGTDNTARAPAKLSSSLSWSLGWGLQSTADGLAFWHWGSNDDTKAFVIVYDKQRAGLVIFTNSDNGMSIVPELVDTAIGGELPALAWLKYERYDSPGNALSKKIRAHGAASALQEYRQGRKGLSAAQTIPESQINRIGYQLLSAKRVKDAIEVFKLTAEDYPKSANVWDSLGEAHLIDGNKELAIQNYQRSLDLDPANKNAQDALKKLRGNHGKAANSPEHRAQVAAADAAYQKREWVVAAAGYRKILTADPSDGLSAYQLGMCLAAQKQWEEALALFQKAESYVPFRALATFRQGACLARLGRPDEAVRTLKRALDLGYISTRNVLTDPDLDALRGRPDFLALERNVFGPSFGDKRPPGGPTHSQMREGIRRLVEVIRSRHPNPYQVLSPEDWDRELKASLARVDQFDEVAFGVELMRLAACVGDVHTAAFPSRDSHVLRKAIGVQFWKFADSLRIRAAQPSLAHLVGAEVLQFGSTPASRAWAQLIKQFPHENEWMSAYRVQYDLRFPDFHKAVGLGDSRDGITLTLRTLDGRVQEVMIPAEDRGGFLAELNETLGFTSPRGWKEGSSLAPVPRWLSKTRTNYWLEYLPADKAIYFQLNLPRDDAKRPWADFLDDLVAQIHKNKSERLIIDLRHNPGGWGYMGPDLVRALRAVPEVNKPGHLFVLISRLTQSAGVVISVALEQQADAVFVGEPLGAKPNSFNGKMGNHPPLSLPGTDFIFRVSEVTEQKSDPLDGRRYIAPDLAVGLTWDDYRQGKDPVLDAALHTPFAVAASWLDDVGGRSLQPYFRFTRKSQWPAWPGEPRIVPYSVSLDDEKAQPPQTPAAGRNQNRFTPPPGQETDAVKKLIDEAEAALGAGKSATEVLTDPSFLPAHPWPRFRKLVRESAKSSQATIVTPQEPGTPLTVVGQVVDKDGQPVIEATVYVYHTSARGWYADQAAHFDAREGDRKHARLFGYLRTDRQGRFELRTIRPAGYPDSDLPAHIHVEITPVSKDFATLVTEIQFDDDARLTPQWRQRSQQEGFQIAKVGTDAEGRQKVKVRFQLRP
jgi:protocatechuate 3,4-dioxygenase beta subunit/tetratricopeptide (TPR) repeat protein